MNDLSRPPVAYLDHAATTPIYPEVIDAMAAQLGRLGNASSLHGSGRDARRVVEESRETIAACLNARPSEVVFTSGGTEANNLALKGFYWARKAADPRRVRILSTVDRAPRDARPAALAGHRPRAPRSSCSPVDQDGSARRRCAAHVDRARPRDRRASSR